MSAASPAPPRVSVMIPVYNEEESLVTLHRELDGDARAAAPALPTFRVGRRTTVP